MLGGPYAFFVLALRVGWLDVNPPLGKPPPAVVITRAADSVVVGQGNASKENFEGMRVREMLAATRVTATTTFFVTAPACYTHLSSAPGHIDFLFVDTDHMDRALDCRLWALSGDSLQLVQGPLAGQFPPRRRVPLRLRAAATVAALGFRSFMGLGRRAWLQVLLRRRRDVRHSFVGLGRARPCAWLLRVLLAWLVVSQPVERELRQEQRDQAAVRLQERCDELREAWAALSCMWRLAKLRENQKARSLEAHVKQPQMLLVLPFSEEWGNDVFSHSGTSSACAAILPAVGNVDTTSLGCFALCCRIGRWTPPACAGPL